MSMAIADRVWPVDWRGHAASGRPRVLGPAFGYAVAFGATLAGGIHVASDADWGGIARGRAALAAVAARVAAADRVLAEAARLVPNGTADAASDEPPRTSDLATLMLRLAETAASGGLRVKSLEPLAGHDTQPDARRTVRIVADGDFPALVRTVARLPELPVLTVPASVRIERGPSLLRIEMSVDVFPALPGGDAVAVNRGGAAPPDGDPFVDVKGPDAAVMLLTRLAGVMRDAHAGLALFDDGAGAIETVATGERVGAGRVVRIEADGVMFSTPDGPRRIGLDDERAR